MIAIFLFNKKEKHQAGFTLMEVMIAITILSLIMLAVVSITESSLTTSERVIREDKELLQIETAMARFEWDFSQIYSPLYFSHLMDPAKMPAEDAEIYAQIISSYQNNQRFNNISFDGIPVPIIQNEERSEVIFFTMSNRRKLKNIKQSRFAWVKYSLIDDENGKVLIRQYATYNPFYREEIEWDDIKDQVLLRKIIKLEFQFWDPIAKKWNTNLRSIKDGKNILRGIKIKITYKDSDENEIYSERIFRPLFPTFKAEDMYEFLNKKLKAEEVE